MTTPAKIIDTSRDSVSLDGRPVAPDTTRRYYVLNEAGRETLQTLKQEWYALTDVLQRLLGKD